METKENRLVHTRITVSGDCHTLFAYFQGDNGDPGSAGEIGLQGMMGDMGDKGQKGGPGFIGDPGKLVSSRAKLFWYLSYGMKPNNFCCL